MSKTNMEKTYLLKKVGKYWLIGAEGRRFKRCPVLTNAKEVEISDNYLIADDDIYEIQENEAGEVTLVKMDDVPIHKSQQSNENIAKNADSSEKEASVGSKEVSWEENNLSDKSGTQEIKDKENTDDRWEDTSSETNSGKEYVDELEMGQTEDDNQLLEAAGHTEETSYIETIPVTETRIGEAENDGILLDNKQEKIKLSNKMLWEVITTRHSNELGQLKANFLDFKYDNGTIFVSIARDSVILKQRLEELKNFIEKFNGKEYGEIPMERKEDKAAIWCDEIESEIGDECCMYVPEQRKVFLYCNGYIDNVKVKHLLLAKSGRIKSTGRRRNISSAIDNVYTSFKSGVAQVSGK